jgi:hypothetical protein
MSKHIVCCGANGRCVIVGDTDTEPIQGEPCRIENARMILYWSGGGLLGMAANGPREGSKLTSEVPVTVTSPVTEWIAVTDIASEGIDYGSGDGYGYGFGSDYGYGSGYGSGYGYGYGDGSGYGYGYSLTVATVSGHAVSVLAPWPYVRIGCETHSLAEWQRDWRTIAQRNGVYVAPSRAAALIAKATAALSDPTPPPQDLKMTGGISGVFND